MPAPAMLMRNLSRRCGGLATRAAVSLLAIVGGSAWAAAPLVVDDAASQAPGTVQLELYGDAWRSAGLESLAGSLGITLGVCPHVDASVGLGYGWQRNRQSSVEPAHEGFLDVNLGLKMEVLSGEAWPFALTVAVAGKLPTASAHASLGTGLADLGALAIATKSWGAISMDVNAGYTWTAVGQRGQRDGDAWFAGWALRWQAAKAVMLYGETYAIWPTDGRAAPTAAVRCGAQWQINDKVSFGGGLGTEFGREAAQLVGTLGVTVELP